MEVKEVVDALKEIANPEKVRFKQQKYGIEAHNALGVMHKELKAIAKEIGMNTPLAEALFDTDIYECRLLCSKIFRPKDLTEAHAEKWVKTFENWEVCDSFCMGIIARSQLAVPKAMEWCEREPEFEKRAGFATMAAYCSADKKAANDVYLSFLPVIENAASDERNFVKKAVNWALRSIGKRNVDLQQAAIASAERILQQDSKAAQWIAKDALKELQSEGCRISDYPRHIYRP